MPYRAVVIGGSAGSFPAVSKILSQLPADYHLPVIIGLHRLKHVREGFSEALNYKASLKVEEPEDKTKILPGKAYLAPANYHLMVETTGNALALSTEEMVKYSRPSINVLFQTAAYRYREKLIAILLSGANTDGVNGMQRVKLRGGMTIAQDPEECTVRTMTESAIKEQVVDRVMSTQDIVSFLKSIR